MSRRDRDESARSARDGVPRDELGDVPVRRGEPRDRASDPMHDPEIKRIDAEYTRTMADVDRKYGPKRESQSETPAAAAPPEREPTRDFPYTREKQPVPGQQQRPQQKPERERPTGQITDESGEYGPERTWYDGDGETDWNKVNRAPRTPAAKSRRPRATGLAPAAAMVAGAIVIGGALGLMNRPAAVGSAVTAASGAAASAAAGGSAAGEVYEMGPVKVLRDTNSTVSRYTLDVFLVPPGDYKWSLDAPCGGIGATQLSALVGWSYDNNTKTCPPGPQGPFPGTVKLTYTAPDGKVYTWSAGSDTGSYGEKVKFTIKK